MDRVVVALIVIAEKRLAVSGTTPVEAGYLRDALHGLKEVLHDLRDPQIDRSVIHRKFSMAMIRLGAGGALDDEEIDK